MVLYIGNALVWLIGILKEKYLGIALVSNAIFMFSLSVGRLLSMILDGLPTTLFIFGFVGESLLGFYSLWVFKTRRQHI